MRNAEHSEVRHGERRGESPAVRNAEHSEVQHEMCIRDRIHSALSIIMEYSIKPKRLGERRIIHYPRKRIIGLYVKLNEKVRK